jgi:putative transposase
MQQRMAFVEEARRRRVPFTTLCGLYEISRKTGYKWLERADAEGDRGLADRSRRPLSNAMAVDDEVVARLVELRTQYPFRGARKLLAWLEKHEPWWLLPVASTVTEILKRHDLVRPRRQRRHTPSRRSPLADATAPNVVWAMDYKGDFRIDRSTRCFPLTVTDACSRMGLCCRGLPTTELLPTKKWLERTFSEWGLPDRMRSDNGTPFGTKRLGPISTLSVWLVKLGVLPEYIDPGSPEQNGRHERFHGTLKQETCIPPAPSMAAQQRRFDRFLDEYNYDRPHEALGQMTPASVHRPSLRPFPSRLEEPSYPDHYELRKVSSRGQIHWKDKALFLAEPLASETVGVVEVDDGCHEIYFASLLVGRLHERLPELGVRRSVELSPMSSV